MCFYSTKFCGDAKQPRATTRKGAPPVERQYSEISYYADDEDGNRKKYTRRGELFLHQILVDCHHFKFSAHFVTNLVASFVNLSDRMQPLFGLC